MLLAKLAFFIADATFLVALVLLAVSAFRVKVRWGLAVLFLPFGALVFASKHWSEVKVRFLVCVGGYMTCVAILLATPELLKDTAKYFPAAKRLAAILGKDANAPDASSSPAERTGKGQPSHEVRDLAENDAPASQAALAAGPAKVDPLATQKAALAQHGADLNAMYQQLNAERPKLKPGTPAVAAFNAKAARYQEGVRALQAEQDQINALEHPGAASNGGAAAVATGKAPAMGGADALATSRVNAEAYLALSQLQTAASVGDYPQFAAVLKKCLADYRQTPSWPQIAALGRQTLQSATPQKLTAAVQQRGVNARTEMAATVKQVQAIVNQIPPVVAKPLGASSATNGFHPGATKPDFNTADLTQGREFYKYDYAQMDGKPGVFYRSADCEFNPQTKFFYTRRDVPKKRLTDAETQRVTALYRTLGRDEKIISALPQQLAAVNQTADDLAALNKQLASYAAR